MGRLPVAAGMGVSMPACTDMRAAISRMVKMVGWHRGRMVLHIGALLYLQVTLSHWYVNRRPGGLRTSSWRFVLGVLLGEGLELC